MVKTLCASTSRQAQSSGGAMRACVSKCVLVCGGAHGSQLEPRAHASAHPPSLKPTPLDWLPELRDRADRARVPPSCVNVSVCFHVAAHILSWHDGAKSEEDDASIFFQTWQSLDRHLLDLLCWWDALSSVQADLQPCVKMLQKSVESAQFVWSNEFFFSLMHNGIWFLFLFSCL